MKNLLNNEKIIKFLFSASQECLTEREAGNDVFSANWRRLVGITPRATHVAVVPVPSIPVGNDIGDGSNELAQLRLVLRNPRCRR